MFSIALQPLERLLPKPAFGELRHWLTARSSGIDIDEMPDSWKRDVGILDGRDRYRPVQRGRIGDR